MQELNDLPRKSESTNQGRKECVVFGVARGMVFVCFVCFIFHLMSNHAKNWCN